MNTFQIRLRQLRLKAGYKSQNDLATALGITQPTVGSWESGARVPRHETLQELARFFDVSIDYLLGTETTEQKADSEAQSVRDQLHKQPGMRMLFSAAKDVDDETLMRTADLLNAMKKQSQPENEWGA